MLWTPMDKETKYKAKNFVDVPVYRGADAAVAQLQRATRRCGLGCANGGVIWSRGRNPLGGKRLVARAKVMKQPPGKGAYASPSSLRRRPVRAMKTSSKVGLASVTESISPGNAAASRAMKPAPSGCSIRTSSFRTLTSTPNESAIFPPKDVASRECALMTSPPISARNSSGVPLGHDPALVDDRHPIAALCFLHQVRGQKDSHVLLVAQAIKRLPKIDPRAGIEPGRGLIEQ